MPKTAEEAYEEILGRIQKESSSFSSWYCGITENIENRLFGDHRVPRKNHWFVYRECTDSNSARRVERRLLNCGCDGGPGGGGGGGGGGDDDDVFVYAYLKTSITSP